MKNVIQSTATLIAIGLLTACAGVGWHSDYKNRDDFNRDKYQCDQDAARMYPPLTAQSNPTYNTNCYGGSGYANCQTTSSNAPAVDINANNRLQAFSSCMQSQGWQWKWGN